MKLLRLGFVLAVIVAAKVQSLEELGEENAEEDDGVLTKYWAVELDSDDESLAQEVARRHGYRYAGRIGSLPRHFQLIREMDHGDSKRGDISYPSLREHPNVKWHEQQKTLKLEKRGFLNKAETDSRRFTAREMKDLNFFNDPQFRNQWYIASYGQDSEPKGSDMGILGAWKEGYSGKGIVVTVMDDGINHQHLDLKKNYDPLASTDLNDNDNDPQPRDKKDQYHGTKCAGEIGAEANNTICGVGLAPNVNLGGIRMLDGHVTGITESKAFGFKPDYVDIFSASWGPKDNGKTLAGPSMLGKRALEWGALNGRKKRGTIYVWASGNGGAAHDDCNCDGYASSIYTLAIGSVSAQGLATYYDEKCASTMGVVYSGDSGGGSISGYHKLITTGEGQECLSHFGGTSAAAPLAAGIFALVLEANPKLTWRDLQHLITKTARKNQKSDPAWKKNGAGLNINHKFGFGLLNAADMIQVAKKWKTVPKQLKCVANVPVDHDQGEIKRAGKITFSVRPDMDEACKDAGGIIKRLEHVQVIINLNHHKRGQISIDIESPSKTRSRILAVRPLDESVVGIKDWPFMTVHMWGENPKGKWTLTIRDNSELHDKRMHTEDSDDDEIQARDEPELPNNDESYIPFRHEVELDESEFEGTENFARQEDVKTKKDIEGELNSWTLVMYGTEE